MQAPRCNLKFVAIDFETADYDPDSACSVALVRVEAGNIVAREHRLIHPPRQGFVFSYLHNIDWEDVEDEPDFKGVWRDLRSMLDGVEFLAAHNAQFDERVLSACCQSARLKPPRLTFGDVSRGLCGSREVLRLRSLRSGAFEAISCATGRGREGCPWRSRMPPRPSLPR